LGQTFYFLLFFPGIIIHEMSHFFIASLLLVPTGEISIFPKEKRIGGIQIAKTDPVRMSIIGLAPMIVGTVAILVIFFLALKLPFEIIGIGKLFSLLKEPINLFWFYLVFAINNTMFTSESDRRYWFGLLFLIILAGSSLYLFGLLSLVAGPLVYYATLAANLITTAYLSTFLVNLLFIIPLFLLKTALETIRYN